MEQITVGNIQNIDKIGDKNLVMVTNKDDDVIGFINKEPNDRYVIKYSCIGFLSGSYVKISDLILDGIVKSGYKFLIDKMI